MGPFLWFFFFSSGNACSGCKHGLRVLLPPRPQRPLLSVEQASHPQHSCGKWRLRCQVNLSCYISCSRLLLLVMLCYSFLLFMVFSFPPGSSYRCRVVAYFDVYFFFFTIHFVGSLGDGGFLHVQSCCLPLCSFSVIASLHCSFLPLLNSKNTEAMEVSMTISRCSEAEEEKECLNAIIVVV